MAEDVTGEGSDVGAVELGIVSERASFGFEIGFGCEFPGGRTSTSFAMIECRSESSET